MESLKLSYSVSQTDYLKQILELQDHGVSMQLGSAHIPKGARLPETGESAFPRHEVSIILQGKIQIDAKDESMVLEGGDIVSIPAQQYSRATALEETKLIYIFFGK